jgi:hypothetical protein
VSVYVFRHVGARWQFEKGAKEALDAGSNGLAPGPELIKLGDDRFGLWFEGGDIHQGYANAYGFLVALSTARVAKAGEFDMGQGNSGSCSDNPKERGDSIHECWEYDGTRQFVRVKGSPYYTLRIAYKGTENPDPTSDEEIAPKNDPVCYVFADDEYGEVDDAKCGSYPSVDERDVVVDRRKSG